ncbi:MAG: hypothetical protein ACHQNT_08985 [Bacteroidia bacterium]
MKQKKVGFFIIPQIKINIGELFVQMILQLLIVEKNWLLGFVLHMQRLQWLL